MTTHELECPLADCPYSRAHYHVGDLEVVFTDKREERGLVSHFVSPTKQCWCGGSVGTRWPGDGEGLGCQLNILHVWDQPQLGPCCPQTVENLNNELCVGAEPDQPTKTQDELLTALDELLDSALHDPECYIDPYDTTCVCVIGKVRAALPPCGATAWAKGVRVCHRNAHPASPDRHVF